MTPVDSDVAAASGLDAGAAYDAIVSRDRRFDGRLWFGVTSTGIYCRPVCPAQTPLRANVRFFAVPAAAVSAGFRACKRCRPDSAPGSRHWNHRHDLTAQALRLIADGVVDDAGVAGLAATLHVSERHIHRTLVAEVGAGPLQLAQSRRAQTARMLLEQTDLPVSDVAFAAGFSSIRQFNDVMKREFGSPPSTLRRPTAPALDAADPILILRLRVRPPYDVDHVGEFLAARAISGLEVHTRTSTGWSHRRIIALPSRPAAVEVSVLDEHVVVRSDGDVRDSAQLVHKVQQWLDLNADPESINDVLSRDVVLRPLVESRPGMRVPTTVDPWETLIRAIVGQQVSVSGATTVLGRLVAATRPQDETGLAAFPCADAVAELGADRIAQLGMPGARARTIAGVAEAIASRNIDLRDPDTAAVRSSLLAMPGLGPWTVDYVRMRGLGDPDAFPETDLILKQNAKRLGLPDNARALANYSRVWSPWRAYAAHHIWSLPKEQR